MLLLFIGVNILVLLIEIITIVVAIQSKNPVVSQISNEDQGTVLATTLLFTAPLTAPIGLLLKEEVQKGGEPLPSANTGNPLKIPGSDDLSTKLLDDENTID